LAAQYGDIFRRLGVEPLINAAGTLTPLTNSVLVPEAREAMAEASRYFVPLIDLQRAAGARIAELSGAEAAMVTSGAAGAIMLATAACVTRGDEEKIRRLPATSGMKDEVIIPSAHRHRAEDGDAVLREHRGIERADQTRGVHQGRQACWGSRLQRRRRRIASG
jgi:L-seryl-tRNA(Ser) seleniumtransferase